MAARKRKSPDRRKPAAAPGLPLRALLAAGTILGRHPKPVLGIAAFGVLFSFVAANALWYQPEGHPAPFWATRDPNDPNAMPGFRRIHHDVAADVTTFRIERASDNPQLANAQTQVSQAQRRASRTLPRAPRPVHRLARRLPLSSVPTIQAPTHRSSRLPPVIRSMRRARMSLSPPFRQSLPVAASMMGQPMALPARAPRRRS